MDMLPFRVSSSPDDRAALTAFASPRSDATLLTSLPLIEPGTNRWIFDDEHVTAWLAGSDGHADADPDARSWVAPGLDATVPTIDKLWLYGPSGSGRTLLAATVVRHLARRLPDEPQHAVGYYFASDGPAENGGAVSCLRALVAQLAQQSVAAYDEFQKSVRLGDLPSVVHESIDGVAARRFNAESCADLGRLLETMSRHFTKVFLVVRGVDYMEAALALQLAAMADAPGSTIKIVFTSSDGGGQQQACIETVSCPVEVAAAQEELSLYIRSEIERRIHQGDTFLESELPRKKIEEHILRNNHGSWLWAVTTLDDQCDLLRRNIWTSLTASDRSQTADTSESAFDPYLERILRDDDPRAKLILTRTAHWLAMTENEPIFRLTCDELLKSLNALYGMKNEQYRDSGQMIRVHDVLHACRPIVRLSDVAGVSYFQFKHKTVYAYLVHMLPSYKMPLREISYDGYTMGRELKDFITICNTLSRSDVDCAESIFKKLLQAQQQLLGHDDAETLFAQEHLASFYWDQGRLDEAERLYLDIVRGYERVPPDISDPHHNVLNNLGILYKRQGRYEEAERFYQAALRGREARHGAAHASTLHTACNIAQLHAERGDATAAQTHWAKALPLCERTFGPHDAKTLSVTYNLGLTHKSLGELDAAGTLLAHALAGHEAVYGRNHGDTLDVVSALAHLHLLRDDDAAAAALYRRALAAHESSGGDGDGIGALRACHGLAKACQGLHRMREAEEMASRALRGFEARAGPDSDDAVDAAYTLFLGYVEEGRLREAVVLGGRLLAGFERCASAAGAAADRQREGIATSVADNMALAHAKLGELAPAEALWRRAHDGHAEARGAGDELTLAAANNLGLLCVRQGGRPVEAEGWLREALEGYQRLEGPEGQTVMRIARDLVLVYKDLGRMAESEAMASWGYR